MVEITNFLGTISIDKRYFSQLIGKTLMSCYGVAGTNSINFKQAVSKLCKRFPFMNRINYFDDGVFVCYKDGKIYVDLHISVLYGVNVNTVVNSIRHKVHYTIEEQTGLNVRQVNIFVDAIVNN
jgi:uncharacterized alkaline shock family protein YloU